MGLDAMVICDCFRNGKTKKPPFPPELLEIRGDDLSWMCEDEYPAEYADQIVEWRENACEHPGLVYTSEHVGNWTGYRAFRNGLAGAGLEHFPTLEAELPGCNEGVTEAAESAKALQELALFRTLKLGQNTYLVDSATGDELYHLGWANGEVNFLDHNFAAVLTTKHLTIREKATGKVVFRSAKFTQRALEGPEVELTDIKTGKTARFSGYVMGHWVEGPDGRITGFEMPAELQVRTRMLTGEDYDYTCRPWKRSSRPQSRPGTQSSGAEDLPWITSVSS